MTIVISRPATMNSATKPAARPTMKKDHRPNPNTRLNS
jgi:hypothetical protein